MRPLLLAGLIFISLPGTSFPQAPGMEVTVQRGHTGAVLVSKADRANNVVATAGKDKTIKIWERSKGRELRTLAGHEYSILDLAIYGQLLASSDAGGVVNIWDYHHGKLIHSWKAHDDGVVSVSFDRTGEILLTSGRDDRVKLWSRSDRNLLWSAGIEGGQQGVRSAFSPDGSRIAAAGDDGFVYLLSPETSSRIDTLRKLNYSFCGGCYAEARFAPQSKWWVTAADRGPVVLRKTDDPGNEIVLAEEVEDFLNLDISDDDKLLVSFPDRVEVFDLETQKRTITIPTLDKEFNHAAFAGGGGSILVSTNSNKTLMFSGNDGKLEMVFQGKLNDSIVGDLDLDPNSYWESYAYNLAILKSGLVISPNGKWAIKGRSGNQVVVWDLQSGKPYRILQGHQKAVVSFEFSPDGQRLVSGDAEGRVIYWDLSSGDTLATRRMHFGIPLSFSFSNSGNLLVSGGYDGYLNVVDLTNFEVLKRINFSGTREYFDSPFTLKFTPNDLYVVAGSLGKELKLIEVDTGKEFKSLIGHTDVVSKFFFEEGRLISASWDGALKSWDYRTGYQEWKIQASNSAINDVLILKSKNWMISAGADRAIKIWDLTSRELISTLKGHTSQVVSLNFLEKEDLLVSSSDHGEIKYWSLETFGNTVTQFFTSPRDWVIVDENGYFNATLGASEAIVFVNRLKSFQPEQFFEKFYNPNLKPLSQGAIRSVAGPALSDMLKDPLPEVEIIVPKDGDEFSSSGIDVLVKTHNKGGKIDEIRLTHNGKMISKKIDDNSKLQQRGKSMTEVYKLDLLPGKNVLEASAFNEQRIESEKAKVVVEYKGVQSVTNCFILSIGINKYKNPQLNLNYARKDAESVVEVLGKNTGEIFDSVKIFQFYDRDATRQNILQALDEVAKAALPSDVLYVYYAGHGSMVENNFYFIPYDNVRLYDEKFLHETAISDEELREKLKAIQALKQVVIIDACQSGGGVQTIAMRGVGNEKAMAQLSRSAGVHVMASAGSEQFASEFKDLGHGLFTYTLLEAIRGSADGAPADEVVSVYELKSYLDAKVPLYSEQYKGQPQYPFTFSMGQDFPVYIVPDR